MGEDRDRVAGLPTSWRHALNTAFAGHAIGLASCGAALMNSRAVATTWLEIAATLFTLGIVSAVFSLFSMRAIAAYDDEMRLTSPSAQQKRHLPTDQLLAAKRLVIACLLAISSVIAFFSGCATAVIALLRY
jgi:phosphate/sulfate permease